jgi:hypothetical protein
LPALCGHAEAKTNRWAMSLAEVRHY